MAQTIKLRKLFTEDQLQLAAHIIKTHKTGGLSPSTKICKKVVEPNIERVNKVVGHECEPMYIAYLLEWHIGRRINGATDSKVQ